MAKQKSDTNNPFAKLNIKDFAPRDEKYSVKNIIKAPKVSAKSPSQNSDPQTEEEEDASFFLNHMSGVQQMESDNSDQKKTFTPKAKTKNKALKVVDKDSDPYRTVSDDKNQDQGLASLADVFLAKEQSLLAKNPDLQGQTFKDMGKLSQLLPQSSNSEKEIIPASSTPLSSASAKAQGKSMEDIVLSDENDDSIFFDAMSDVKNLQGKGREIVPEKPKPNLAPVEVGNPLQDIIAGKLEFAVHNTDQYVEGHVVGLDLMTLGKLQARQYSPEAHIDLHGLNAEQSYNNLVAFFRNSYHRGLRTVLVVTGKGKNSFNGTPILRTKVQEWFTKDPFKRVVLAFCSAKEEDGGAGALYVLIRKRKKEYGKIQWDMSPTDPDLFL